MAKPKGKHPHNALTATAIRNQAKPGRYADGQGLFLIVDRTGNKRWLLRMTVQNKRRDIGLGGWPSVSLADARKEVLRMRQIAKDGGNPIAERRRTRQAVPTFKEAAERVHSEHESSWRNAKHRAQWINTLKTYAFPLLGDLPVNVIDSAEVVEVLSPIWLPKHETARRVRQRIGTVLDWAKAKGYRDTENPVRSVLRALPRSPKLVKHHASLPYRQMPNFVQSLRETESDSSTRLALEFLILTATRTSEVLKATWAEIDLSEKVWSIPADRMKARREFRIPLSARAIQVLKETRPLSNGEGYIFPGKQAGKPLSQMALLMLIRRMKLEITTHGFRSTFRDWAAEQTNFPREICEAALAHSLKDKTEAAYLRTDQFGKRRHLMTAWSRYSSQSPNENIVRLHDSEPDRRSGKKSNG